MVKIIRILIINSLIALFLIVVFDVTMLIFLSSQYTHNFTDYRRKLPPIVGGQGNIGKNYFIKNESRGFDIGRNKNSHHWVDGITYPIWSNSLGCFDNEHAAYDKYIYFAGDSFTWGYTPFDMKFGTIIERVTGTQILKCGVTHTGQIHQFSKFVELVANIGNFPKAIFVFYYSNDVADDYAHPHSTVIQGWLVDSVYLDKYDEIVQISRQDLRKRMSDKIDDLNLKVGWWESIKNTLKYYSLTTNIVVYFKDYVYSKITSTRSHSNVKKERPFHHISEKKNGRHWYFDNPKAQMNKEALIKFKKFSTINNIVLSVVLIPNANEFSNTNWYEGVRDFLSLNKIRYIDLSFNFKDKELSSKELSWENDGHFNPFGNEVVAEILINEFPDIFLND